MAYTELCSQYATLKATNLIENHYDSEQVIELATIGGARALHMDDKIGSLEIGKKADVIIVETQSANMMPNYNPYATLVYQANPSNVKHHHC